MSYEFDGVVYSCKKDMQAARRDKYLELVQCGLNFTQAAKAVGAKN